MDCEYSWVEALTRGELLPFKNLIQLFNNAYQILAAEPNIIEIDGNITVAANTRGNFKSLLHILKTAGHAPRTRYLFIGGYTGREQSNLSSLLLLLALKELYPHQTTLIQGRDIVYTEYVRNDLALMSQYTPEEQEQIMLSISDILTAMPLVAILNKKTLCIHGGLVPDINSLHQIMAIDRFAPVDPNEIDARDCLVSGYVEPDQEGWGLSNFGSGFTYGKDIFEKFMKENNLEDLICAHLRNTEGYRVIFDGKLLELFSAADYLGIGNKGSIVQIVVDANGTISENIVTYGPSLSDE